MSAAMESSGKRLAAITDFAGVQLPEYWRFPAESARVADACEREARAHSHQVERRYVLGWNAERNWLELWIVIANPETGAIYGAFNESFPCPPICNGDPPGGGG
jgi:hypothetical protein